jgi:hypothetical protein
MSRKRKRETGHLRVLSTLTGAAITAALPAACGSKGGDAAQDSGSAQDALAEPADDVSKANADSSVSSDSSGGDDGSAEAGSSSGIGVDADSSSGSGSGSSSGPCPPPTVTSFTVDPTRCEPQLQSEMAYGSFVCQWTIEQPCFGDAGAADGGAVDGGDADGPPNPCAVCDALVDGGNLGSACGTTLVPSGGYVTTCGYCCVGGRAPRGFVAARVRTRSARAARLAHMAQLEAASVDAFHALRADLARLGAPRRLLHAVRTAARDEIRHARAVRHLAERFGAHVPRVRVLAVGTRSAEQLAVENAEEGCVRETFGAALAAVQAERARDARVRRMMRVIAREELAHAALAWNVAQWLDRWLDAAARARVGRARVAALSKLEAEIRSDRAQGEDPVLGLPDKRVIAALFERLRLPLTHGPRIVT